MKSKWRKIIIDNVEYNWCSGKYNCDGDGGVRLSIKKNMKDSDYFYQEIFHSTNITPKIVRDKILQILNKD